MSDKRSVHTDALETLGTIIEHGERDAIHLAVEPVIAGEKLKPGENIGIEDGVAYKNNVKHLGIVDPFLKNPVKEGEKFWLIVYPRQITSLRHVWSHPDFNDEFIIKNTDKELAYKWIQNYADEVGADTKDLIEYGTNYYRDSKNGLWPDYLNYGEVLDGEYTSDEFWVQLGIYLGEELDERYTGNFFTCSC